eukprot:Gb_19391 [translate_table: standard]
MALGCFPRVKIVHTSQQYEGQIYSAEVNYVLMVICIVILGGFKGGSEIGNAYEGVYVTVVMNKVPEGGWVPFLIAVIFLTIMLSWNYGRQKNDLIHGLSPIIQLYVKNVSSLHEILIIVTIRFVPVKTVLPEERFLVRKLEPKGVYRSKELLHSSGNLDEGRNDIQLHSYSRSAISNVPVKYSYSSTYEELQELELAKNKGAVFVLGKTTL